MTDQLRALEEELVENPDNREAFTQLQRQLWDDGDWRAVQQLYLEVDKLSPGLPDFEELVAALRDFDDELEPGPEKAQLWLTLGDLYRERLDADEEGMQAYQTAFKVYPDDVTPLRRARRVYRSRGEWKVLIDVYNIEYRVASTPEERVELLIDIAQIYGDKLGQFGKALESLERIEELDGDGPFVEQLIELYVSERTVEDAILQALEEAETALNDGAVDRAVEAFIDASQLEYERYGGSLKEAQSLAESALQANPDHQDARLIAQALTEELLDPDEDADGESTEAAVNGDTGETATAGESAPDDGASESENPPSEMAEESSQLDEPSTPDVDDDGPRTVEGFYETIDDFDGSLDEAHQALEQDRTNLSALKTIRQALLDEGNLAALAQVLEDSVRYFRKKDGEWEVMTELANLYWLELGDDEQAEYYFKRLKLLDSDHPDVFKFYEAYYEAEGNWRKLFTLLSGRLELIDDREDYRLAAERLSEIAELELGSPEKAIDVWKTFVRRFPDDDEAGRRLRHLYEDHGKWNALVDLLKGQVRRLAQEDDDHSGQRVSLLEEMAHIYRTHLNLDTMVMNIMGQILELDPHHPSAFGQLRDLYESNRRFNDLATLLSEAAERAIESGDVGTAIGYLLEVADIWEEKLNNQTQAIPHLERIVEIAPEEADVRSRLRDIYENRRDFSSLFDLRLQETQLVDGEELIDELQELLELTRERLRDPRREVAVLTRLLDVKGDDLELMVQRAEVLEELEDWSALADNFEEMAGLLEAEEAIEALSRAAELHGEKLEQPQEAARLWSEIRARDSDHVRAFEELVEIRVEQRDYDEVEALFDAMGRLEELFELLADVADERGDDAQDLHGRRIEIARDEFEDDHLVVEAMEALRDVADDPDEVRRELLGWYDRIQAVDREIETRRALLESGLEGNALYDEMLTIASLEDQREQPDAALGWALKAFERDPSRAEAIDYGEELGRKTGMLEALIDRADEVAERLDDETLCDSIEARCARLQWRDLDAHKAAIERYEALRQRHPQDIEFLEALDELYESVGEPELRIEVLQAQIDLLREQGAADVDLVDQLSKIADVQRRHLGESEAARETYSEILDLQPDHLGAVRGKKELHREEQRWQDVVDHLLREIPLAAYESPEAQWRAKLELADVYRTELEDLQEALRYYGEILAENPEYEEALNAVRQLLAEDHLAREAAILLEPIFRDRQQTAPLAEALEARLRVCDDRFEEQEILDELIPIYADDLEEFEVAFEHARRQFEIDPERDDIWLRFEQLGARLNRWELLEEMFTRESPLEGHESSTRFDLLRHLAAIREHQLDQTERALEAWQRLHEYDPLDAPALEALERLYRKTENTERLVDVLRARADVVAVDEDRIELLVEAGDLLAEELDDPQEAIAVFRRVLSVDPEHSTAVEKLEALFRREQQWHDLESLLFDQSDQTLQPDRRRELLRKLAVLRLEELGDTQGSVTIVSELLEDDPGDDEVLDFARQLDAHLADDASQIDLRLDLMRTLEPIYRMRNEYDRLDTMLEVRLDGGVSEFEQIEILDELVELRQKRLTDPEGALDALKRAVVIQPDEERRRKKLLELSSGLERLPEAMETLEEAARQADPFVAVAIWKRLGELAIQKLNEPADAIDYYEEARQLDDADEEILTVLGQLFEATSQSERLCDNLAAQARFADPDRRLELLRRIGTLRHHVLEQPVEAIDAYRQILEMEPGDMGAIEALEGLFEEGEEYFELVELLRQKVDLVESSEARIEVYQRWATLAEEELQDLEQAIDIYRRILDEDPEHRRALAELDRLLQEQMQWTEWSEIVQRRLAGPERDDVQVRLDLELRLSRILVDELLALDRALELYRGILERHPLHDEAVQALEEFAQQDSMLEDVATDLVDIYREQDRWEDLADLYERRRNQAMNPEIAAEFEGRRAALLRDRLEQPAEAMRAFGRAWCTDIEEAKYRRELIDLARATEHWELLVELIDDGLEMVVDPELTQQLHMMLAEVWNDVLDDSMEAQNHLREVLRADPYHDEAFGTLSEILHGEERWFDLVELLEQRLDAVITENDQEAIELLMTIAGIQEIHLDDGFSAVETLRRVRAIDERYDQAVEELQRLLTEQQRWEDLADFYERRATSSPLPSERLNAELELADLCRGPLNQPDRAIELYGRALSIDAEHQRAIEALEEVFEEAPDRRAEVAKYLEPIYRARQAVGDLVRVLLARANATDDVDERLPWLRELLDLICDFLDDPKLAWQVAADLFSDAPGEERAREKLWELSARAHAWPELAEVYAKTLEKHLGLDDQLRARLHVECAELYADRMGDVPTGREAAEQALELIPDSDEVVDTVERLMEREGAWHDLADFYRGRAQFSADEQRVRFWYEKLAALYEDVIDDIDATVDVYARLLEIAPGDEGYRSAMERVLTTVERWYELADIYRQRIAGAPDLEVVTDNRLTLAGLLESELDNVEEAVELYRQILDDHPGHSDATRALEGLRRDLESREGNWKPLRRKILSVLLEAYDERKAWRRVDDIRDQQVELCEDPAEQVEILVEKAQLLLRATHDDIERVHALTTLAKAFCLEPTNEEIEELIEVLAEDLEAWQRIIPIYLRALEQTNDVDRQGHILAAVAQIYEYRIQDIESATAAYQQSVEISAESEIALEKLQELYGEMEKWGPLVDILERRLQEFSDSDRQRALRKRIARIYDEKLDDPEQALRLYHEIRRQEPDELAHLVVMERLYESLQDYEGLEELLIDKLQFVDASELRLRAFKRLGEIRRDHLDRFDDAIASFHDALELAPDNVEVLEALIDLYRRAQRWPELLDVLRDRRDQAEAVEKINEIEIEMGDVLLEQLNDAQGAFERYQTVLERNPENYVARGALFRLLNDPSLRRSVAEILIDLHRQLQEWDELEALHQRLIEVSDDPDYIGEQYLALARMQERDLGIAFKAFATLSTAVQQVAELDDVRAELERLAEALDSTADLVAIYEDALASGVDDPQVRRSLHMVVGSGYGEQEKYEQAIPHLEAILELDEFDVDALSWLHTIYQAQRDWENLARILENKRTVGPADEQRQATYQLGYIREVVDEDYLEALELYRSVLAEEPTHAGAIEGMERLCAEDELRAEILELLEPIYRDQGHWAKLSRLFSLKLEVVDDSLARADLHRQIADVEYNQLDHVETGFRQWCQAFAEDPHDSDVQWKLRDIAEVRGWFPDLIDLYEGIALELDDPMRTLELAEEAAGWAMEKLDSPRRAAALYRIVVDVEPEHEEALEILETVAREEGDDESLAAVLGARVKSTFDEATQIELYTELASVHLSLQNYEKAIEAFEKLNLLDGENLERLETLSQLFELSDRWQDFVDIQERLMAYRDDDISKREMLVEMGQVCLAKLDNPERAREKLDEAHRIDPQNRAVMRELEEVYEQLQDWSALEALLGRELELVEQEEEAIRLYVRRARMRYEVSNDAEAAIADYQAAFALRDDHPDVMEALDELYRSEGRWEDLLGLLNTRVNRVSSEGEAIPLMMEMCAIAQDKLQALERAAEFASTVLDWDGTHGEAIDRLERIHRSRGNWDDVVDVIDHRIQLAEDLDERLALLRERARTLEEDAGQLAAAADTYQLLLETTPDDEALIDHLGELYDEIDDGEGMYSLLSHRADRASDDAARIDLYVEMAEVARKYLGGGEKRIQPLEAARGIGGDDLEIVEPLLDAYIDSGQVGRAEPLLESVIQTLTDARKTKETVRFYHLRGKLAEQQGDRQAAKEAYREAHRLDATYIPNLLSLGVLLFDGQEYEEAKKIFQVLLLHQMNIKDESDKVEVYFHLGAIREHNGDERGAKDMYKRALRVDPDHGDTNAALAALEG